MRDALRPAAFNMECARAGCFAVVQTVHGTPPGYLGNAATIQKPWRTFEALGRYWRRDSANVHRGAHVLSERATAFCETVRGKLQEFRSARPTQDVAFVHGTTEAINLAARKWGRSGLCADDGVAIVESEHHSNIVPRQMLCIQAGAKLRVVPDTVRAPFALYRTGGKPMHRRRACTGKRRCSDDR
ncbi:MAG: aminotransferase class V-fold PLP-dependent enzyme [Acidiferrobacterales bacterium]